MSSNSAGNSTRRQPRGGHPSRFRKPRDRKGGFLVTDLAVYLHTQTWKIRALASSSGVALKTISPVFPRASQYKHFQLLSPAEAAAVVAEFRRLSHNQDA